MSAEDTEFSHNLGHKSCFVLLSAKALSSGTFLTLYLAASLFLVACAHEMLFAA